MVAGDVSAPSSDAITLGPTPVAEALRSARRNAGLSVSALARAAKTSRAAVYAYESGDRDPGVTTALRLLHHCGAVVNVVPVGIPETPRPARRGKRRSTRSTT
ncbi:MAG: helix-turn-helix transcriptional regulator [Candidatus Nanopelagicales bacterium]|nr:helix-turn-helix transcriptional regulator [Candidatus Nanopelagicales bacterium]